MKATVSLPILGILTEICSKLENRGIQFCHWKSNFHLSFAMSGDEDWDILVECERFNEFLEILCGLGAKHARPRGRNDQFGVYHYYVPDPTTGKLVHIHCYSKIISGDSLCKSYRFPIETMLLENLRQDLMPVPTKEAELVVFLLRNVIKALSPIDLFLVKRSGAYPSEELSWLRDGLDNRRFNELLAEFFPQISQELAHRFLDGVASERYDAATLRAAWTIGRSVRLYRRFSWLRTHAHSLSKLSQILFRKFILSRKYKTLESGGIVIAVTGPQAVGKSTVIKYVSKWLSQELDVRSTHVGKPGPTLLTLPIRLLLPVMRRLMPSQKSINVEKTMAEQETSNKKASMMHVVRKLVLAYERRRLLTRIFRAAANGQIVFCDRYPSDLIGAVDGSSFDDELIAAQGSALKRWLMQMERRQYDRVCPPDLVLKFFVDPEVAVVRNRERNKKGDQDEAYVRFRHGMAAQPVFTRSKVLEFDTSGELEDTVAEVTRAVWREL